MSYSPPNAQDDIAAGNGEVQLLTPGRGRRNGGRIEPANNGSGRERNRVRAGEPGGGIVR